LAFREGFEASLIVGIVLGYLRKLGRSDRARSVWLGVAAATVASLAFAAALTAAGASFEGRGEDIFEGITMFIAAAMLTWMIVWMQACGRSLRESWSRMWALPWPVGGAGRSSPSPS